MVGLHKRQKISLTVVVVDLLEALWNGTASHFVTASDNSSFIDDLHYVF